VTQPKLRYAEKGAYLCQFQAVDLAIIILLGHAHLAKLEHIWLRIYTKTLLAPPAQLEHTIQAQELQPAYLVV
jgi:hypothetical protein